MVKKYLKLVLSSLVAGIVMGLAGFELIAMKANDAFIAGAFIQSFGLLFVLYANLMLATAHSCSIFTSKHKLITSIDLLIALVINLSTIIGMGYLIRLISNGNPGFIAAAEGFTATRIVAINDIQGKAWYMALISGIICGVMMALGGKIFREQKHPLVKLSAVVLAVGIYVVCGFENIMTNTLYIAYAQVWNLGTFLDLLLVLIGNLTGTYFVYFTAKFLSRK